MGGADIHSITSAVTAVSTIGEHVRAEGIVYYFIQHPIYHSLVQQLGAESDRTRQKNKRSTRVWEFRDKNQ